MKIAGYTVIEPLGQDTASTVYLAKREHLETRYAVRILSEVAAANSDSARAFIAGAKKASDMSHPLLVKTHEFGEHEGRPFCVMDFISGSTLAGKYHNLCLLDKLYVVKEIARALEYLAKFGLAHGHVNLANIFIREPDSRVVLGGLGFDPAAISLADEGSAIPVQSASFMSLEQLGGGEVTPRSDIYSLGVVFYVLLENELPYQANTFEELWDQVQTGEVPVVEAGKNIFRPILARMLANNPDERYASIADFIAEINRISDEQILLADHIAVEPPSAPKIPATGEPVAGAEFPQTHAAHRPGSGKVISLVQRLNAMAHEQQQEESEVSRILSEHPEILDADAKSHRNQRNNDDGPGNHETESTHERGSEKNWDNARLVQVVNHPQVPEQDARDQLKTHPPGQPTQAKQYSEAAADSHLQSNAPDQKISQKSGSAHKRSISAPGARSKPDRRPANRAGVPQHTPSTAATKSVSGNHVSSQHASTVAATPKPTSRHTSGKISTARIDQNRADALNYQPHRAALAKDRPGHYRGTMKAYPWRIVALIIMLLAAAIVFMLPPHAQLQLYDEVIEPARQYLTTYLGYAITWLRELAGT